MADSQSSQKVPELPRKLDELNLDGVAGGQLEWGICEFFDMDAEDYPVGSFAITSGNWWYQCKAADETNYWFCTAFSDKTPRVIHARTRNSNE